MNYYAFHIGDYASATAHLSLLEDGVYRRLLDVYYTREAPIPTDHRQACRLVRAQTEAEREAVAIVLSEFFVESPEGYRHVRCDAEIARANEKKNKASQSASKRWSNAKAMPTQCDFDANASDEACERIDSGCEGNAPNPNPNPNKKPKAPPAALPSWLPLEAWNGYLEMRRKIRKSPTDRAIGLVIAKLEALMAAGQDPGAVLDESTKNSWIDVFPVRQDRQQGGQHRGPGGFVG